MVWDKARIANRRREALRPKDPTSIDFELDRDHIPDGYPRADLELLVKANTWYCDGTFFVVRPTFTQLFGVHAFIRQHRDYKQAPSSSSILMELAAPRAPARPRQDARRRDLRRLRGAATKTKRAAFAEGTWANLRAYLRAFLLFCTYYTPFPVDVLEPFAEFLGRSFRARAAIFNYLSGLKTLHVILNEGPPNSL
ncbi:hypothetical protein Bbelb_050090 [Branchiostoma belcheri]|nr:hypothetical protein Bbelb_050090 [Branchiostoma belcheri]